MKQHQDDLEHGRLPQRARRRAPQADDGAAPRPTTARRLDRLLTRVRRTIADVDYFLAVPLSWRDGGVVVWAGMRGAVTVAAAQTLPPNAPHRALLVILAFLVAALSLVVQGGTLRGFVRVVKPTPAPGPEDQIPQRAALFDLLTETAEQTPPGNGSAKQDQLVAIQAQRDALLDARDDGLYDSETLTAALESLDADQISLELQGGPQG